MGEPTLIRLMLIDDEPLTRRGLKAVLDSAPDLQVVAECTGGKEALRTARGTRPHIVLINVHLNDHDGVDLITEILHLGLPSLRVVVLTSCEHSSCLYRSLTAGARGYLHKTDDEGALLRALREVNGGNAVICPKMTKKLLDKFELVPLAAPDSYPDVLSVLSDRELQVLARIAKGKSNSEIARELNLTGATVKSHVSHLLGKLEIRDRVQAALLAYKSGLAHQPDPRLTSRR